MELWKKGSRCKSKIQYKENRIIHLFLLEHMQSKEETRNETVRKRNCGNKQAEHDEVLSVVWDESIEAGKQITEEYRERREKVMEYKDFVEQVKEQDTGFLRELQMQRFLFIR